ncbi:serine/threonine-protein phosphatase 2A activator 1 [Pseudovirgaria hyperparasitica]|uniref:Serine/threonine-protein phosphatase 2A activator n=1 Tax=Pseudovirgaria hyperparasitica TaxID=470096 RepID=A0A6A6WCH6_9PEZI|nr:serine/threonine-protein phosphatase 2A activator 1 [Pseudovirgaria hyperparasitica]KAF2760275.1 serine/threonine-protein phosphatase 2A activator 1 [Pseudovirgaria hyperparasitica]
MSEVRINQCSLPVWDAVTKCEFTIPKKQINDGADVSFFLSSMAYRDIWSFIFQLNASIFPRLAPNDQECHSGVTTYELSSKHVTYSSAVKKLGNLMEELSKIIDEVPPDTGPRRFGNVSFRKWYEIVKKRLPHMMEEYLPTQVLNFGNQSSGEVTSKDELEAYLYGSFGSAQRLDYGSGHELSFLAFLGGIWKLGGFNVTEHEEEERGIVLGVVEPYLRLVRRLILTYTLEPAGSHGVWGLDDHSFLPYIFGSAQLSPPIRSPADITDEGSVDGAPNPADVAKADAVQRERKTNMYFSAIGFIYDVKKGPFWEHSPILFDISGVKAGWAKINKGMMKMYNAEVLSKFPVVQHFPFGSIYEWQRDPEAVTAQQTAHTSNQPNRNGYQTTSMAGCDRAVPVSSSYTARTNATTLPTASIVSRAPPPTAAPWARASSQTAPTPVTPQGDSTAAPWARRGGAGAASSEFSSARLPPTQAPWARQPPSG